ncbi:hypothetical protein AAFF_G00295480 [Aldrovandia affinis]|uniref:Amino acid transporter transmembrane domain-containing protein n=1 Tax=Aldrovandia affinis TaxID=143900 RepID=A0AAD7R8T4_9TELE|nr:hypothetical protein AAFF_G00295480 [Aldrovandia affinis]
MSGRLVKVPLGPQILSDGEEISHTALWDSGIITTESMEPAQSEMSILSNGKGQDLGDDFMPMKSLAEEDQFEDGEGILAENEEFLPKSEGKKPMRFTDFEGKTSFGMSVFNLGNAIMGSGILGLAYAMANTGILLFLWGQGRVGVGGDRRRGPIGCDVIPSPALDPLCRPRHTEVTQRSQLSVTTLADPNSRAHGIVPQVWKHSTVIPIPKKGSPRRLNDPRPVARTSLVMKAFERMVKSHITQATTAQLDPLQSAFRAGVSRPWAALHEVMEWCDTSCLELNVTKTKEMVVVVSSRQQQSSLATVSDLCPSGATAPRGLEWARSPTDPQESWERIGSFLGGGINEFLLTAVAALSSYSIHLLLKSSGIVGIRAYEQLGFRAFGTPGKMAAGIAITLQNIGAMSSYLYIVKSELPLVIHAFLKGEDTAGEWYLNGNYLVVLVSMSVILPLAMMKQLGYLGYTSGFSLSCMVFFLISVIYKRFQIPCPFQEYSSNSTAAILNSTIAGYHNGHVPAEDDISCSPRMFTVNSQTAYTIPILAFAFVCHPEVLPIYTELRNPTQRKMQHVSNISILIMYVMYFLAALFGYLTFYGRVEPELLHTYSRIDPYDTLILCVRVAVLTAVTLTVPIVLFPVRRAIQQMIFPNKTFSWLRHVAIAVLLLTLINMLVIFAPNILGIFGIIGATSAPCLIFIFPAIFYIRIMPKDQEPTHSTPKVLASCFAAVGVLFMIMSLSFIIIDWSTGGGNAGSGH